ncbi:MAG: hypothetical protein U9Q81_24960 [Pseudomonadota bacterium]|nr:hypothetical protein [Pseudomonadota bacterium]
MPKTEEELLERDAGREIGAELLESFREIQAGESGGPCTARLPLPAIEWRCPISAFTWRQ